MLFVILNNGFTILERTEGIGILATEKFIELYLTVKQ